MNGLEKRIADNLAKAGVSPGDRLVLACSGGVDSAVLAHVLARIAPATSLTLAHANHGLRALASDGDEVYVRELAALYGMGYASARLPVAEHAATTGQSLEEAGRALRYEWLERVRADTGAVAVLVAHHADDLAETMLYRLARGSGLRGLRALSLRRGGIVRPMLDIDRADIEAYAREHGVEWREDATNLDTDIARNLLRHEIMPRLERIHPAYRRAFERFSRYAADCADFIDDSVRAWLGELPYFCVTRLRDAPDFFQREIVRYLYESAHGSTVGLSEASIWEIIRFVYNSWNPTAKSLGSLDLRKIWDRVYFRDYPLTKPVPMSEKSVFTRIIEGELPCYKIYEDDLVMAFLDINPVALGHTLVVPKAQIDRFEDLPHVTAANLFITSQKIAKAIKAATGCERVGVIIAGFDVPHTHLHLVPANEMSDMNPANARKREDAEMREIMEKIVENLD